MLSYSKSPGFLGDFDFLFEKHLIGRLPRISADSKNFFFTNGEKYVKILINIIYEKI